jgi:type IX secretion system PorP/SprF family membrane protein
MHLRTNLLLFLVLNTFSIREVCAQQLPQYSQWSSHQMALNPAHSGIKSCMEFHTLYRAQWVGFDGNPRSGFLTISAPIPSPRKKLLSSRHGWGVKMEMDRIGHFSAHRMNLAYAGHFNFTKDLRLSMGMYFGVVQLGFNPSDAVMLEPDPTVNRELSLIAPDASFGAWWNGKNYYIGAVLQQLIRNDWDDLGLDARFRTHATINAGFLQPLSEYVTLLPGLIVRIPPGGRVSFDAQAMLDYKNKLTLGLGYRNADALILQVGIKWNPKFSIHYSFDATTSQLRNFSNNTHEFSIVFNNCFAESKNNLKCALF